MIAAHLTDAEIQLYVAEPEMTGDQLKMHIHDCVNCRTRAANYRLLFDGIHRQEKPQFDFDLSTLVLEQLPEPKRASPLTGIFISVFSLLLISALIIFFWPIVNAAIRSTPLLLITIGLTAAIVILVFQAIEMIKNHQKQVYTILNTKPLQL